MLPGLCCCSLLIFSFHEGFRGTSHLGEGTGTVQIHRKAAQGHFIRGRRVGDLGHQHQKGCPPRGDSWDHLRTSRALPVCTLPVRPNPPSTPTHLHKQMRLHSLKDGSPGSSLTWSQGHHHPDGLAYVREGEAPQLERQRCECWLSRALLKEHPPGRLFVIPARCLPSSANPRMRDAAEEGSTKIRDNTPHEIPHLPPL